MPLVDVSGFLPLVSSWSGFTSSVYEDHANHKKFALLLPFYSLFNEDELVSLDNYVDSMKESQNAIYYIAADNITSARNVTFCYGYPWFAVALLDIIFYLSGIVPYRSN